MTAFSPEFLKQLHAELDALDTEYERLLLAFVRHQFKEKKASEYATHGFARRVSTQVRCIKNVFRTLPPDRITLPVRDELVDAQINLQSFVLNTFGALDNLAWIWVTERNVRDKHGNPLSKYDVGLSQKRKAVRASLTPPLLKHLKEVDPWLLALEDYRDSLAHRIPLYIPPFQLTPETGAQYSDLEERMQSALAGQRLAEYEQLSAEQEALCVFMPVMKHSFAENSNATVFHPQMFADFKTTHALGMMLLSEV